MAATRLGGTVLMVEGHQTMRWRPSRCREHSSGHTTANAPPAARGDSSLRGEQERNATISSSRRKPATWNARWSARTNPGSRRRRHRAPSCATSHRLVHKQQEPRLCLNAGIRLCRQRHAGKAPSVDPRRPAPPRRARGMFARCRRQPELTYRSRIHFSGTEP